MVHKPSGVAGISEVWSMTMPYLCQVSTRVSCGACCGLYNVYNLTSVGLEALLTDRTDAFARLPQEAEAIEDFGRQQLGWSPHDRPFPHFHHCPYVGLIGRHCTRVGCLLHPDQPGNNGQDWRHLSYYGAKACQTYFCPTTKRLDTKQQEIIRQGIDHWYLYGLTITEHRLWSAFFREWEERIGRETRRDDFRSTAAVEQLRTFAALKIDWPFKRSGSQAPRHYFFDDARYPRPAVERVGRNIPASPFDPIFWELESRFEDTAVLQQAESIIAGIFDELAAIVSRGR